MAIFKDTPESWQRIDWKILRDGGVALYHDISALEQDRSWLVSHGYKIVDFDGRDWSSMSAMHRDLASKLRLPKHYGHNFDGLRDCLAADFQVPSEGGTALVFRNLDAAKLSSDKGTLSSLSEICSEASRVNLMLGRRLVAQFHTDPTTAARCFFSQ